MASAQTILPQGRTETVEDIDVDQQLLWEVENTSRVWVAGEAAMVRTLRRRLITELGIDRRCTAFMGYWRAGQAERNG
jgi:NADPH-dependent ferric siderophore reductase